MRFKITYEKREIEVPVMSIELIDEFREKAPEQYERLRQMRAKETQRQDMLNTFKRQNGDAEHNRRYPEEERLPPIELKDKKHGKRNIQTI